MFVLPEEEEEVPHQQLLLLPLQLIRPHLHCPLAAEQHAERERLHVQQQKPLLQKMQLRRLLGLLLQPRMRQRAVNSESVCCVWA